jgi:hypothetical protein
MIRDRIITHAGPRLQSGPVQANPLVAFCTPRRVRTYPRITLTVLAVTVGLYFAGSTGWRSANGQLLFHDFIIFYSAGTLFHTAPQSLYDFGEQLSLQRSLVSPVQMDGTGPFSHPPYVAPLLAALTVLPLPYALILWTLLSFAALAGAIALVQRLIRKEPWNLVVPMRTLVVIALSLAPIVWGLCAGQMHAFVLFGSLAVVVFVLEDKPWHAGAVAGLLTIKPQVALAFLIFFVVRRNIRACVAAVLAFGCVNALLIGAVGFRTAVSLYATYIDITHALTMLPFTDGFPRYLLLTPYGLMSGLVGTEHQGAILMTANVLAAATVLWYLLDALRGRNASDAGEHLLLGRTLLLPSLLTPYLMVYDAAPLMVSCLLIGRSMMPGVTLAMSGMVYFGLLIYPVVSSLVGIPLGALLPIGLWIASIQLRVPPLSIEAPQRIAQGTRSA